MSLLTQTDKEKSQNLYLVVTYKPKENLLLTKHVSDLSTVNYKSDYIHFKTKELTPITITRTHVKENDTYHEYFQYFVMEKEEIEFQSFQLEMANDIIITINRTKDGYFHGTMNSENAIVWDEKVREDDVDGLVFASYRKHWVDMNGQFQISIKCKAKFKFA